jgi:hypothetical protein
VYKKLKDHKIIRETTYNSLCCYAVVPDVHDVYLNSSKAKPLSLSFSLFHSRCVLLKSSQRVFFFVCPCVGFLQKILFQLFCGEFLKKIKKIF